MEKIRTHKNIHIITLNKLSIKIQTLSYRNVIYLEKLFNNSHSVTALLEAFELGFIKAEKDGKPYPKEKLSYEEMKYIGEQIYNLSQVTQEEYESLLNSISIYFDSQLKSENWNCDVCKSRKLDRVRNCGYRNELNKNKSFKMYIGNKVFTSCPIYFIDKKILGDAIECFNMYDNGFLPDKGGLYDQTKFFNLSAPLLKQKIAEEQQKEIEQLQQHNKSSIS